MKPTHNYILSAATPFTEESLHKLHTLTQATTIPSPEVLDIWASLFHVSLPVLQYAIEVVLPSHYQTTPTTSPNTCQSPTSPTCVPSPRSRRLPTPPRSSTPELDPRDQWSRDRSSSEFLKGEIPSPMISNMIAAGGSQDLYLQHNYLSHSDSASAYLPAPARVPASVFKEPHSHVRVIYIHFIFLVLEFEPLALPC